MSYKLRFARILCYLVLFMAGQSLWAQTWIDLGATAQGHMFVGFEQIVRIESGLDAQHNPILHLTLADRTGTIDTADTTAMQNIKQKVASGGAAWLQVDPKSGYVYARAESITTARFTCSGSVCVATLQLRTGAQARILDPGDYNQLHQGVSTATKQWFASQLISGTAESYENLYYLKDINFQVAGSQCIGSLEFYGGRTLQIKDNAGLARLKQVFNVSCP